MNEPEWKDNPGYCPEEIKGHDVEMLFRGGGRARNYNPGGRDWSCAGVPSDILKYKDWTEFENKKNKEWNGEGLPPVGARCKVLGPLGLWYGDFQVIHITEWGLCIAVDEKRKTMFHSIDPEKFQLYESEEDCFVEEMVNMIKSGDSETLSEVARALYKAGYRKQ